MIKVSRYFIPYIIFLIIIGYKGQLFYTFIIVFLHELTHYMFARKYGFIGFDVEFLAVGASLKFQDLDEATPKEDLIISMAGPMMNILLAVVFCILYKCYSVENYYMLFAANMSIGIFNLIPAFPLDGGRILRDLLCLKLTYRRANKLVINISIILGILLIFFYVLLFLRNKNNFTIGIIGLFIIISSLKERERIPYIIMGDIIKKRYKFIKKGHIENKAVSVYYKQNLLEVMALIDKNKYNIFTILDDNMNVLEVIYESDIINGLKNYGNISLEEYIKKY